MRVYILREVLFLLVVLFSTKASGVSAQHRVNPLETYIENRALSSNKVSPLSRVSSMEGHYASNTSENVVQADALGETFPSSVSDPSGNVWIAFEDENVTRNSNNVLGISVYMLASGSTVWQKIFDVGEENKLYAYPSITYAGGEIFLAYMILDNAGSVLGMSRIATTGNLTTLTTLSPPLPASTGDITAVRVSSDAEDSDTTPSVYLSYIYGPGSSSNNLYFTRSTSGSLGNTWDSPISLGDVELGAFRGYYNSLGMDYGGGIIYVAYISGLNESALSVKQSSDNGATFSTQTILHAAEDISTETTFFSLDVAATGANALVSSSILQLDGLSELGDFDVTSFFTEDSGVNWTEQSIEEGESIAVTSDATHDGNGNFYVAYVSDRHISEEGFDVFVASSPLTPDVSGASHVNKLVTTNAAAIIPPALTGSFSGSGAGVSFAAELVEDNSDMYFSEVIEPVLYSYDMSLTEGWNMISVPVLAPNMAASDLFVGSGIDVFAYTDGLGDADTVGYDAAGLLAVGSGYWINMATSGIHTVTGIGDYPSELSLRAGWNLLGPF